MASQLDMFPEPPPQLTLWGEDMSSYRPDSDDVRRRLQAMIAAARALAAPPRERREWRSNITLFPQMARWLPEDEAAQLCFEFDQEVRRLGLAA